MRPEPPEPVVDIPPSGGDPFAPHDFFGGLRKAGPVHRVRLHNGREAWLVTPFDAIVRLLKDRRLARTPPSYPGSMDTERLRGAIASLLSRDRVDALGPALAAQASGLLADLGTRAAGDLVSGYCLPLAGAAFDELLAVPLMDRPLVARRVLAFSPAWTPADAGEERRDALAWLRGYFAGIAGADAAEAYVMLAVAGFEPAANLLSASLLALLRDPERLMDLKQLPGRCRAAAHELARYDGPVYPGVFRHAAVAFNLFGRTVATGDLVLLPVCAAGRDPERYRAPDRLDWTRKGPRHLAYGLGPHACPGAALATGIQEAGIAAFALLLPEAKLDGDPVWSEAPVRALQKLSVKPGGAIRRRATYPSPD